MSGQSAIKTEASRAEAVVRLERNARGQLVLHRGGAGEPIVGVRVARCFPWSLPQQYISIRDEQGNELHLFESLKQAEPQTRQIIEQELAAQEFVPAITAVERIDDAFDVMTWQVQTDRGPVELQVKSDEDVRQLADGRVLIKDHAGGLFEVRDMQRLDSRSRRLLEDHLG